MVWSLCLLPAYWRKLKTTCGRHRTDCRMKHWITYNINASRIVGREGKEDHKLRMPTEWKSSFYLCAPEALPHEKQRLEKTSWGVSQAGLLLLAGSNRNTWHLSNCWWGTPKSVKSFWWCSKFTFCSFSSLSRHSPPYCCVIHLASNLDGDEVF